MSPEATIGSISQEISWYQTRPVLAFWRTGNSGIARCRVRFLLNGKDFASGLMISNQVGPSVLTACQLIQGGGTYHPHFDAPADGVFLAHDLRLRIECEGTELVLKRLTSTSWWLGNSLGGMSMAFGPAQYDGEQRQTIAETHENGLSRLDLILHQGKTVQLAPENLRETMASVLIQWSTRPVPKPLPPIIALPSEDRIRLTWEQADVALALTLARHPKDRDALVALNVDSGFATKGSFQD
jgi:hypothetical protein